MSLFRKPKKNLSEIEGLSSRTKMMSRTTLLKKYIQIFQSSNKKRKTKRKIKINRRMKRSLYLVSTMRRKNS